MVGSFFFFFFTKIDKKKTGTLILTSPLEDLVNQMKYHWALDMSLPSAHHSARATRGGLAGGAAGRGPGKAGGRERGGAGAAGGDELLAVLSPLVWVPSETKKLDSHLLSSCKNQKVKLSFFRVHGL